MRRLLRNGHRFAVLRHPSRNALSDAQFQPVDHIGMRILRSSKHKFVAFENIDETGVALDERRGKFDNASQNFVKPVRGTQADANFVKHIYV